MRFFVRLIIILFIFLAGFSNPAHAIKIGLLDGAKETDIAVSADGSIFDGYSGKQIMKMQPMAAYTLKSGRKSIAIKVNNRYYNLNTNKIIVKTTGDKGYVFAKKKWYRQNLNIEKKSDGLCVINNINLELYLLGVVPSEMPSKWNIEAHKAQAIAARSYAIANLGKRGSRGYDLKDTPEDQAYGGASAETTKTNNAVMLTKGQVLTYNGKIISAYYHASAGGQTTTSGQVWCKNLPYLKSVPSFDGNIGKKGHGVGMSQYGANALANHGYTAYQILAYFYSDVKLGFTDHNY